MGDVREFVSRVLNLVIHEQTEFAVEDHAPGQEIILVSEIVAHS